MIKYLFLLLILTVGCDRTPLLKAPTPTPPVVVNDPTITLPARAEARSLCEGNCLVNSEDEVMRWNSIALSLISKNKTPPPKASRMLAILHASIYDALINSNDNKKYFYTKPNRLVKFYKESVIAGASQVILSSFFPLDATDISMEMYKTFSQLPNSQILIEGYRLGRDTAYVILNSRANDQVSLPSPNLTGIGYWEPTFPDYKPYLLPGWADTTPFVMEFAGQFRQEGPPSVNSVEYLNEINEVRLVADKLSITPQNREIALFWAADAGTVTPPGQWNEILKIILKPRVRTLEESAEAYLLLNLALADAAISAWDMKYSFFLWRPISAIRNQGYSTWVPFMDTPPHPDYVSGHSTFSGAASKVLALYFGTDNIPFIYKSAGFTRSFPSLSAAAIEASESRILGGIHTRSACEDGITAGQQIGTWVFENALK